MAKSGRSGKEGNGLYRIHVTSSGSYSVKSEDIFRDKDASLSTLRELRSIVSGYKERQQEKTSENERMGRVNSPRRG